MSRKVAEALARGAYARLGADIGVEVTGIAGPGGGSAEKPVGIAWNAEDLHPSGACGNATRADASKGAKHLAYLADRLATLVAELAAMPLATLK